MVGPLSRRPLCRGSCWVIVPHAPPKNKNLHPLHPLRIPSTMPEYQFHMEEAFGFLSHIDLPKLIAETTEPWVNHTLVTINGCAVRIGIIEGDFHWHRHADEDEFFLVLEGELLIDVDHEQGDEPVTITLRPHEGYAVPRGVLHRTRAPKRTAMLMVEKASVDPTGS